MRRTGTILIAASMAIAACTASASLETGEKPSQFVELLTLAPYEGSIGYTELINMDLLFETAGYDHDAACAASTGEEFSQLLVDVIGRPANTNLPPLFYNSPRTFDELPTAFGFAHCEIDSYLQVETPNFYVWVDKDGDEIAEQAAKDPDWADSVSVSTGNGVTVLDWGDSFDFERATPLRLVGTGGRLVISDHIVGRILSADDVDLVLDPDSRRVIDRPHVRSIVEQLEARAAHTIVLTDRPFFNTSSFDILFDAPPGLLDDQPSELPASDPGLAPWITMAYGSATSEQHGEVAIVALGHFTPAEVEANMSRFPEVIASGQSYRGDVPWSDVLTLVDIESDGLLVIATLVAADDDHPFQTVSKAYVALDSLLSLDSDYVAE